MNGLVVALCLSADTKILAPDITRSPFPKQTVQGKLFGKPFVPTKVIFKKVGEQRISGPGKDRSIQYAISFRIGNGFIADQEISLWVAIDPTEKFENLNIVEKPHRFFDEEGKKDFMWKGKKRNVGMGITTAFVNIFEPKTRAEVVSERFSAKLHIGKQKGSKLPGQIMLVLPDNLGYVAGSFVAFQK